MVLNIDKGTVLINCMQKADNYWLRLMGLLPKKNISCEEGLLLSPCNSVHTAFMRFAIDVVYLDASMRVIATYENVKPWRFLPLKRKGRFVLETAPGIIENSGTQVGDFLQVI